MQVLQIDDKRVRAKTIKYKNLLDSIEIIDSEIFELELEQHDLFKLRESLTVEVEKIQADIVEDSMRIRRWNRNLK